MARTISGATLVLGAALLWFLPLGGVLLLFYGCLGLAISWEAPMGGLTTAPSITTAGHPPASQPLNASFIDH